MLRTAHTERSLQNRVPWNLAGLVSQLPPESGTAPYPPPSAAHHQPPYYPSEAPPAEGNSPWQPPPGMPLEAYKVDPECNAGGNIYYGQHGPASSSAPEVRASEAPPSSSGTGDPLAVFSQHHHPPHSHQQQHPQHPQQPQGAPQQPMEHSDVMQTLHQYFSPSDMGPAEENNPGGNWMDPNGVVVAQGIGAEAAYNEYHGLPGTASSRVGNNTYGDRKKKIIKEWTKIHTSESSSEGGPRPYLPPPGASDFLSPYYSHHIKDEPAFRAAVEYQQYTQYYQESSLHPPYGGGPMVAEGLPGLLPAGPTPSRRKERKKKNGSSSSSGHPPVQSPGLSGLSRDERKALTLGLPISVGDIINLPMDEFNDLLSKHELTEEQLTLCRDIRRRGKNKVAARNCRKRKIDQIKQLEDDVTRIRCRKTELVQEHEKLSSQRSHWTDMVRRLHDYVLKELGHDPLHWELQMDHSRQVHIIPRSQNPGDHSKHRPYHYAPSVGPPVMEGTLPPHIPR